MPDGSLIFNTRIDTSGIEDGIKELEKKEVNLEVPVKGKVSVDKTETQQSVTDAVSDVKAPDVPLNADVSGIVENVKNTEIPALKYTFENADGQTIEQIISEANTVISEKVIEAPVHPKIDTTEFDAFKAELEQRQLEQDVEAKLKEEEYAQKRAKIEADKIDVPVDVDMTDAKEKMSWLEKKLSGMPKTVQTAIGNSIGKILGTVGGAVITRLGNSLTGSITKNEQISGAFDSLNGAVDSMFDDAVTALAPQIIAVSDAAEKAVDWLSKCITSVAELFAPPKDKLSVAINEIKTNMENLQKSINDAKNSLGTGIDDAAKDQATASTLLDQYDEILGKEKLTQADVDNLQRLAAAVVQIYPDMGKCINENTGLFNTNTTAIRDNITALTAQAQQSAYLTASAKLQETLIDLTVERAKAQNALDEAIANKENNVVDLQAYDEAGWALARGGKDAEASATQILALAPALQRYFTQLKDGSYILSEAAQGEYGLISALIEFNKARDEAANKSKAFNDQTQAAQGAVDELDGKITETTENIQAYADAALTLGQNSPAVDSLNKAADKTKEVTDETAATKAEVEASVASVEELTKRIQEASDKGVAAKDALTAIKEQVDTESATLMEQLDTICTNLGVYMTNQITVLRQIIAGAKPGAVTAGAEIAAGAGAGYRSNNSLTNEAAAGTRRALSAVNSYQNGFFNAGYNLAAGMAEGVRSGTGRLEAAVRASILQALQAARSAGEISSPSKLFEREVGAYLGEGVGVGFTGAMPDVMGEMQANIRMMPAQLQATNDLSIDYGALSSAIWANAPKSGGGNVYLDGALVGKMVSPTVSREIDRAAWAGRYSG